MNRFACQYAIVRYLPFVETGEFANVGILLFAPKLNYMGYKLMDRRYARITHFFDDIDAGMYRAAIANLKVELARIAGLVEQKHSVSYPNSLPTAFFDEIVRPRESIIRFGERRMVLTADPQAKLNDLFDLYVKRNFATKEYRELVLDRGVKALLQNAKIHSFAQGKVGGNNYEVAFPFLERRQEKPYRAIKPLNLNQDDSSKILEHGGKWEFRIRELVRRNALPERVLFAIEGPTEDGPRKGAYDDVVSMLQKLEVDTTPYKNTDRIIEFAKDS